MENARVYAGCEYEEIIANYAKIARKSASKSREHCLALYADKQGEGGLRLNLLILNKFRNWFQRIIIGHALLFFGDITLSDIIRAQHSRIPHPNICLLYTSPSPRDRG